MATKPQRRGQQHNQIATGRDEHRVVKVHHGPLPDPETLREYDNLIPGAAAEIIKMASDEAIHRRNLEKLAQQSDAEARDKQLEIERSRILGALYSDRLGVFLGWFIAVVCVGAAIWSALFDKSPFVTIAFLGFPIAAIINAIRKKQ